MQYTQHSYYHIYNRGIDRRPIFTVEDNYLYFIRLLRNNHKRYAISILVYCLIPNHYHLVVYQNSEIPTSRFVQSLNNAFVQGMNKQLNRKGTLFEGRTKARLIDEEEYLRQVCRYVHLNPIKHKLVQNLLDWKYSNYWVCVKGGDDGLTDTEFIDVLFCSRERYREFVEGSTPTPEEINDLKGYMFE